VPSSALFSITQEFPGKTTGPFARALDSVALDGLLDTSRKILWLFLIAILHGTQFGGSPHTDRVALFGKLGQ
jgi:hypothetical protein